jgi:U-box domain
MRQVREEELFYFDTSRFLSNTKHYNSHLLVSYSALSSSLPFSLCFTCASDPYNRQPLTMKMIEPLPELKKKIEDWVKTKISEGAAKAKSQNSSEEPVGKSEE